MLDPDDLEPLWRDPDGPTCLRDYLERDGPQLGVVIASFDDATLISFTWPHTLFDAVAFGDLLRAWSQMLHGRQQGIPEPVGAVDDPLAEFGLHSSVPHKLEKHRLSRLKFVLHMCRSAWHLHFHEQKKRVIYVPGPFLKELREKAIRDTQSDHLDDFLSEGDVLWAWWAKLNVSHHLSPSSRRDVNLSYALDWRPVLTAAGLIAPQRPLLSNAVGVISTLIPARDMMDKSVGQIARFIRQSITEFRTKQQVEAWAALWRTAPWNTLPLFGNTTMLVASCTNWSKAKLFDIDLSAALVGCEKTDASPQQHSGRPVYIQRRSSGVPLGNETAILGKDSRGGYWITAGTDANHWAAIESAIGQYSESGIV